MKKFIPYPDKVQIKPIEVDSLLRGENNQYLEMGEVINVGSSCKFLKTGDTVFFDAWGMSKTPDEDGVQYFVVPDESKFILGKYNGSKKK